jgi:hypothetical protein
LFNPLTITNDTGKAEMQKRREYKRIALSFNFWRTYDRQEIDLVAEEAGKLRAYEIKWRKNRVTAPKAWRDNYPASEFAVIHRDNHLKYIS